MKEEKYVAGKDRIGLNKEWSRDIEYCSETFRTENYANAVDRFLHNMLNIRDGPQLKTSIKNYQMKELAKFKSDRLDKWKDANPFDVNSMEAMDEEKEAINLEAYEMLYAFIIQLIEDSGFCYYVSNDEPVDNVINIGRRGHID